MKELDENKQIELSQLEKTQQELDELKEIIVENVEKVLKRGINLSNLNQSCEYLEQQSQQFTKTSKKVRIKLCLKNKKYYIILVMILIIILSVTFILAYYFLLNKNN